MMNMMAADGSIRARASERHYENCNGRSVAACVDSFEAAMLVIDDSLRILDANANALAALDCRADESDFGRYVIGDAPSQSLDLRRKIRAAIANRSRALLALNHPRRGRLICSVKGITPLHSAIPQGLVILTCEDRPPLDVAPYLIQVYKLSKAEAEIAIAASRGAEVSQIMLDRKVSLHTLRAQIASIKAKMGLHRMTEVAVAVARLQAAALI